MDTYQAILATISCLATVATGISAVVAVIHYRRHWRDDEVRLAVELHDEATEMRDGLQEWHAAVRVTNVGKVPVTLAGLELADDPEQKRMSLVTSVYFDGLLNQGAAFECGAFVTARNKGVPLPERITIRCKWAKAKQPNGYVVVEPHKVGSAGQ